MMDVFRKFDLKRILATFIVIFLAACTVTDKQTATVVDPFLVLSDAYLKRDADMAASAYTQNAVLTYNYETGVETYSGSSEIAASFKDFFDRLDPELVLELSFKLVATDGDKSNQQDGFYRLRFGDRQTSYGRFETVLEVSSEGSVLFLSDTSYESTQEMFERVADDVIRQSEN